VCRTFVSSPLLLPTRRQSLVISGFRLKHIFLHLGRDADCTAFLAVSLFLHVFRKGFPTSFIYDAPFSAHLRGSRDHGRPCVCAEQWQWHTDSLSLPAFPGVEYGRVRHHSSMSSQSSDDPASAPRSGTRFLAAMSKPKLTHHSCAGSYRDGIRHWMLTTIGCVRCWMLVRLVDNGDRGRKHTGVHLDGW
jgi:hypothetical protein